MSLKSSPYLCAYIFSSEVCLPFVMNVSPPCCRVKLSTRCISATRWRATSSERPLLSAGMGVAESTATGTAAHRILPPSRNVSDAINTSSTSTARDLYIVRLIMSCSDILIETRNSTEWRTGCRVSCGYIIFCNTKKSRT